MSTMKRVVEDYAIAIVNPHLKGLVKEIRTIQKTSKKQLTVRAKLGTADLKQATKSTPKRVALETLAGQMLDRLALSRYGYTCRIAFQAMDDD